MSGKIIMIGSMKGGVSKTVTTFNLAYSLSKLGRKCWQWISIVRLIYRLALEWKM